MLGKFIILTGVALLAATPASAEDAAQGQEATTVPTEVPNFTDQLEPMAALGDEELGALRGGEGVVVANQTLVAITSGNVIAGDYSAGSVSLSDFALSNFNGLGNLLINTGAQVSLQTGMNLTINVGD